MTIASEIARIQGNIEDAYNACAAKGATMPVTNNSASLVNTIDSISGGGGSGGVVGKYMVVNGVAVLQDNSLTNRFDGIVEAVENGMANALAYGSQYNTPVVFSDLTTVATNSLFNTFLGCENIPSVSFPKLNSISGNNSFYFTFQTCYGLTTASFPSLVVSGRSSFRSTFAGCSNLTTIEFNNLTDTNVAGLVLIANGCTNMRNLYAPNLTNVGDSGLYMALCGCTNLTDVSFPSVVNVDNDGCALLCQYSRNVTNINFDNLATANRNSFYKAFQGCNLITQAVFPNLTTMRGSYPNGCFDYAFQSCVNLRALYFNSLSSVESERCFSSMLSGDTDVTVHFPAAMQSVIGSWSVVTGGFSGTNTTVLFDL